MAEFVGYRHERMLPEYEEMKSKQICTDDEIRTIIKTREMYNYKITKQTRTMVDYCQFISYERELLSTITEREKRRSEKVSNVQYSIANHIKNLYIDGLRYFPQDLRFWDAFFKFLKKTKFIPEVSSSFEKMLAYHGDKPSVWVKAALFEYYEVQNMEKVKDLFMRGLQRHPENEELHLKFFKIMLNEASKMSAELNLQKNTESEQSLGLERVLVIYKSSKKKILSIDYFVKLLEITEQYPFTKDLQKIICEDMMSSFPRNETMWHTLAQRELRGLNMCDLIGTPPDEKLNTEMEIEQIPTNNDNNNINVANEDSNVNAVIPILEDNKISVNTVAIAGGQKRTLKRRIELCYEVYNAAVKELKTEKICSYFLNAMLNLNQDLSTQRGLKRTKLAQAFKVAHEANCMSEDHYLMFIDLLKESNDTNPEIENIMKAATKRHSKSEKLWEQYMYYYICKNDHIKLDEIFRNAIKELNDDKSHSLYRLMIQYYLTNWDLSGKVDEMFMETCKKTTENFAPFRERYLEYTVINKDLEETRKIYNELAQLPPPCLELHQKMAYLESQALKPNIAKWRECHEYTTQFFGKTNTAVWINYLQFERDHGEPKSMTGIYERAKQTLDTNLVDNFISEHTLFMTGIM